MWRIASATDSYRRNSEDRAAVVLFGEEAMLAIADGVGGRAGGAAAADAVVNAVLSHTTGDRRRFALDPLGWLMGVDRAMAEADAVGESTAVVVHLTAQGVLGATVGDSAAWDVGPDSFTNLTAGSEPKPWLGSGVAIPRPFAVPRNDRGTLLLATDGLVKYAKASAICEAVRTAPFEDIPKRLTDLARMPNGVLQDDVAVIVARWEPGDESQEERG